MTSQDSASSTLKVTYDSSNAQMQWRCHLYMMRNVRVLLVVGAIAVALAYIKVWLLIPFLCGLAAYYALYFIAISAIIKKRTANPRICTTIISEEGVRDIIPEYDQTFPWQSIKKIEIVDCDVYFLTATGGIFIPATAFQSKQAALDFYKEAHAFSAASRHQSPSSSPQREQIQPGQQPQSQLQRDQLKHDQTPRNQNSLPSSKDLALKEKASKMEPPQLRVDDLLAEDDSVWVALEESHKKSQAQAQSPEQTEDKESV